MNLPIRGIIPPLVTPLINSQKVDDRGLHRLIEHVIEGGVHGLFLLGTTGEAPSLSYQLRETFVRKACGIIAGRVPVMVGITETSAEVALEMAGRYRDAGADAVVVAPPYYIPISQDELLNYLHSLVPRLPLPFILYNIPSYTKIHISLETINMAKEMGALGIKDSSGDMSYLYALIDRFKDSPDFSIITGTEIYLPETIMQGGHGAVAGGANLFPKLFVELYKASLACDTAKIRTLRDVVIKIYNSVYNVVDEASRYTVSSKCALGVMGICNDYVAPPLKQFNADTRKKIKLSIEEIQEMLN
jgi:2-dehydro-3-deoxy-D-pentonate aldolase